MKNRFLLLTAAALFLFLSSCGVNQALMVNLNQNTTQVHLGSKNFNVVGKVSGTAEVSYVLIFGGLNKRRLFQDAYTAMVNEANLTGSKALINMVTEEHVGGFPPFYTIRTLTVSANVVEFTN
jgi:hypothetical protein